MDGELARANGDHKIAFAQYETKFRKYASVSQKVDAGRLLAPSTRRGMWMRNRVFSVVGLFIPLMKLTDRFATDIKLKDDSVSLAHWLLGPRCTNETCAESWFHLVDF